MNPLIELFNYHTFSSVIFGHLLDTLPEDKVALLHHMNVSSKMREYFPFLFNRPSRSLNVRQRDSVLNTSKRELVNDMYLLVSATQQLGS